MTMNFKIEDEFVISILFSLCLKNSLNEKNDFLISFINLIQL